ncbi:MAG TPA: hypothetical protein VIJ55_10990 [Acetobacteraceae bacterium]
MSAEAATAPSAASPGLSMVQAYQPTTFLERGVAVPFTTPALLGARARPATRGGLEILVPNPAGGAGVYVLPWAGVNELCRPTVHDILLGQRVAALRSVTPASVRALARDIAAEGMAGRDAVAAAHAAVESDRQDCLGANFQLLLALVGQIEPAELADLGEDRTRSAELECRARRAVARIGPRLGRIAASLPEVLDEVARAFAGIGAPAQAPPPRIIRLMAAVGRLRADMAAWSMERKDDSAGQADLIAAIADVTLTCAERTVADAHAMTEDLAGMLRCWATSSAALACRISRPEWLVDGWEKICLIWRCADADAARRSALMEMTILLPVLPREVSAWIGTPVDVDTVWRFRAEAPRRGDWPTGGTLDRIARNEALRALEV